MKDHRDLTPKERDHRVRQCEKTVLQQANFRGETAERARAQARLAGEVADHKLRNPT